MDIQFALALSKKIDLKIDRKDFPESIEFNEAPPCETCLYKHELDLTGRCGNQYENLNNKNL